VCVRVCVCVCVHVCARVCMCVWVRKGSMRKPFTYACVHGIVCHACMWHVKCMWHVCGMCLQYCSKSLQTTILTPPPHTYGQTQISSKGDRLFCRSNSPAALTPAITLIILQYCTPSSELSHGQVSKCNSNWTEFKFGLLKSVCKNKYKSDGK
jgi:hypothetical protein